MRIRVLFFLCLSDCFAAEGAELYTGTNELVLSVTTNHYIPCSMTGRVDIVFEDAVTIFQQPDILDLIQAEYAAELPAGLKPKFTVVPGGSNTWSFVNEEKQTTEIHEISRTVPAHGNDVDVLYYIRGERFFGWFRAAFAVHLERCDAQTSSYSVNVWAYPESGFTRFFARHLGLIESFFHNRSEQMTALTVKVSRGLLEKIGARRKTAPGATVDSH